MSTEWEFHKRQRKMSLTTSIFNNVLQRSGFTEAERLTREAVQNAVDAHRRDATEPVSIRVEKAVFRGDDKMELVRALRLDGEPAERQHLFDLPAQNALATMTDPNEPLSVLSISDYCTCGLGGKWNGTEEGDHFGRLVVNLGVDDKAEGAEISGGSFGFGKTVYAKSSSIGVVAFYSVFQPTQETEMKHARFMATGIFKSHSFRDVKYDGFAFFGAPDNAHPSEVVPLNNDEAHDIASRCGMNRRSPSELGTTIMILDCHVTVDELRRAAELYWWPRLIRNELDLVFVDEGVESWPRPRRNSEMLPFIDAYQNYVSEHEDPPRAKLKHFRRLTTASGMKRPGTLSCLRPDVETPFANKVALVRGPGMVVKYIDAGSDAFVPCIGIFQAHADVDKILTYSEPQMHDDWDPNQDRLMQRFGEDGVTVVAAIRSRIPREFKQFQKTQEPPVPPGGLNPKELNKLLGRFLDVPGKTPSRPRPGESRPIEMRVQEDRVQADSQTYDTARIGLALRDDQDREEMTCKVEVHHEILGDASQRVVSRSSCQLLDEDGATLAVGAPATVDLVLHRGTNVTLTAKASVDADALARVRVVVEEVRTVVEEVRG